MVKEFKEGQKAYLDFLEEPEEVTIVRPPYFNQKSMDMRIMIKSTGGIERDPIPQLVYHSKEEIYKNRIRKSKENIKKTKEAISHLKPSHFKEEKEQ